jgi:hypothetical protein
METKNPSPILAGILSFAVPELGQIYAGKSERGAMILIAVILVGGMNAIWLSLYNISDPGATNARWIYTLPRILHDIFAIYGVVFWIWQVVDAYKLAKM